jgi:molybdopterin-guanine dinucleotide biosynthesis protein A
MAESVSGVILAGGRGSRLGGRNKALLEIGGRSNVDRIAQALGPLCSELIAVTNDDCLAGVSGLRLVLDNLPHGGVLPALLQGLDAARGDLAIVVACDMPFLEPRLLADLVRRAAPVDVVLPIVQDRPEPMHAVYRRATCVRAIRASLDAGQQRMIDFLGQLRVERVPEAELRRLDSDLLSFFNTNTPDDLARAEVLGER